MSTSKGIARTFYTSQQSSAAKVSSLIGVGSSVFCIPSGPVILNISNEGTIDWIMNLGAGNSLQQFETPPSWTWKLLGTSRGNIRSFALDPGLDNQGVGINTMTASPLELNVNNGDNARWCVTPNRQAAFPGPLSLGSVVGLGHRVIYPGDGSGSTRQFNVYVWTNKQNVDVTFRAHLMSAAAADISFTQNNTNPFDGASLLFQVKANIVFGDALCFDAQVTALNGSTFCGAGIQAISVF